MKRELGFLFVVAALIFLVAPVRLPHGADASGGHRSPSYGAIPEYRPYTGGRPSKGKFLVASRRMADPRFRETVILLVKHDWSGTMGLIINRPTEIKLSSLFPEIKGLQKRADAAFVGGPVGRSQMFMLIRSVAPPEESLHVMQDVYVSSGMVLLKRIANDGRGKERFRLYDGYAGWAVGQLEGEVMRGDWHVLEADAETVFEKDPERIWPDLILRGAAIQARLAESRFRILSLLFVGPNLHLPAEL